MDGHKNERERRREKEGRTFHKHLLLLWLLVEKVKHRSCNKQNCSLMGFTLGTRRKMDYIHAC